MPAIGGMVSGFPFFGGVAAFFGVAGISITGMSMPDMSCAIAGSFVAPFAGAGAFFGSVAGMGISMPGMLCFE